mmetsp:Transcript_79602/g.182344  ORF Transcript_79602/g.182344 Transcript_79602/m.182344 type:complete len:132 (-) Transcript_79602:300-695(-)
MYRAAPTPESRGVSRRHSKNEFYRAYYLPSSAVKKSVLSDDLAYAQEFYNDELVLPPPSRHGIGLTTPSHACLDMTGFRKWKAVADRDRLGSAHSSVARCVHETNGKLYSCADSVGEVFSISDPDPVEDRG